MPRRERETKGRRAAPSGGALPERDATGERLLDVHEAAALLSVSPRTLYQWAYKRRISVVKLFGPHGALRFRLSDVERLIKDSFRPAGKKATEANESHVKEPER